jgi:aminoglycoside phosphotransferase (APT) family kinase protein
MSALPDPHGGLSSLRTALGINYYGHHTFQKQSLSRNKIPALTFKVTHTQTSNSWVVKFSPVDKQNDPWYDVSREYYILNDVQRHDGFPAPKPIYESSVSDVKIVGTRFIVMEFVSGLNYKCVADVPEDVRLKAFTSVMGMIAWVHTFSWITQDDTEIEHSNAQFWRLQVNTWNTNYRRAVGCGGGQSLFDTMLHGRKPFGNARQIIHGDLDISNIIFDQWHNVKVFVDWKFDQNGDPMIDVAYFNMMFLKPENFGHPNLRRLPLLTGESKTVSEDALLAVYQQNNPVLNFDYSGYCYAKAVCCLRLISVVAAASKDRFQGHESGQYPLIKHHSDAIKGLLMSAGRHFLEFSGLG